jgi:hypothetical protein
MEPELNMYTLGLNESMETEEGFEITRVPGGWIYFLGDAYGKAICFVPFNSEFNV